MDRREFVKSGGAALAILAKGNAWGAQLFSRHGMSVSARLNRYENAKVQATSAITLDAAHTGEHVLELESSRWICSWTVRDVADRTDALALIASFRLTRGSLVNAAAAIEIEFNNWSEKNYVCMPGAVYNGNRYESRPMHYPPLLQNPADIGPNVAPIVSDIPRLNIHAGPSRIQQVTRDMATPAMGFMDPAAKSACWLLTPPRTAWAESGLDIEENEDRTKAIFRVTAPFVRQGALYKLCNFGPPSEDRGASFQAGDVVEIPVRLYLFPAPDIQALLSRFLVIRKDMTGLGKLEHCLPFSASWKLHEAKYNLSNWREDPGYYAVEVRKNGHQRVWTAGWVGGLQATYPLLFEGTKLSKERSKRNFDFVFPKGISKSGFFYGAGNGETFLSDAQPWLLPDEEFEKFTQPGFFAPLAYRRWHLVRKSGDVLYYMIKQFDLLKRQDPAWEPPAPWLEGTKRCADAFVRLWDKWGQFGQFVDIDTGDVRVGGSTSPAIACAGLALASLYFKDDRYLKVAEAAAEAYCAHDLRSGITTGGPLEIAQAADCESAYGLLVSLMVLFETTGDRRWLDRAIDAGALFATWVVSYDYRFPLQSKYGRLGMRTLGTMFASAQNKCAVPGICSHSGSSLLKLYRATGNVLYLDLINEIAHSLSQYVSREDRPIDPLWPGAMNERIEMADWLEPIGEIFDSSSWAEVADMLTYVEVPGLYVNPDTGFFRALDHVNVTTKENSPARLVLQVTNPTKFDANVKILSEDSAEMSRPLGQNYLLNCSRIEVPAGLAREVEFKKQANLPASAQRAQGSEAR